MRSGGLSRTITSPNRGEYASGGKDTRYINQVLTRLGYHLNGGVEE